MKLDEHALKMILEPMGVRALTLPDGRAIRQVPLRDAVMVRLALPMFRVDVEIDSDMRTVDAAVDHVWRLNRGARELFRGVVDYIAKHDTSPIERTRDLEAAATKLLEALGMLDEVRMPFGAGSVVTNAAHELRELIKSKTGAVLWRCNGYGNDPPEVKVEVSL